MSAPIHIFCLVITCAIVSARPISAQMGVRLGFQHERVTGVNSGADWHVLLGWDYDLNDRLSGGLDFSTDTNWEEEYTMPPSLTGNQYYTERTKVMGVQFRSQYHFSDNDGTSLYLGPTLGLRLVKQMVQYTDEVSSGGWSHSYTQRTKEDNAVLFPIGMRLGVRGALDGGYADLYVAIGANIGSNEPICDLPFLAEESMPKKMFLQAGISYGIGW